MGEGDHSNAWSLLWFLHQTLTITMIFHPLSFVLKDFHRTHAETQHVILHSTAHPRVTSACLLHERYKVTIEFMGNMVTSRFLLLLSCPLQKEIIISQFPPG